MTGRFGVFFSILLLAAFTASSCTTYKPVDQAFHLALTQPYVLDSGDRIRITVFGQADLSSSYSVDKAGFIEFPLIGSVVARGETPKQIEASIAAKLKSGYVRDPDVSAEIERYRPFFIMGEVNAAGQYTYVPGMTLQNAIAVAGGFSPRAAQETADITRQVNGSILTGRVPEPRRTSWSRRTMSLPSPTCFAVTGAL
jgi:polysaccharide export outer membrane protein